MTWIPERFRRQVVEAHGRGSTYREIAGLFGIGEATVSRILRRYREENSCALKPRSGGHRREIDLEWLEEHALMEPDATLSQRAEAWACKSGSLLHVSTLSRAMRAIGWTHKKRHQWPENATGLTSKKR